MYIHRINYQLGCRKCKTIGVPEIVMIKSEKDETEFSRNKSRDKLLELMKDSFSKIPCNYCGATGNWNCFKIYINDNDNVNDQFMINIFKENGKIWGKPQDGMFSPAQLEISFMRIDEKIEEEQFNYYPSKPKGSAFIMVDFMNDEPYSRISVFDLDGITVEEVRQFIDAYTGKKSPKGVYPPLKAKLERAFEDLKKDNKNPLVIAHLKDKDEEVNIYLIAKDPNEEMYYGILENKFVTQRQITGIPLSNIKAMEVEEVPMIPFRAKPYIENGVKLQN